MGRCALVCTGALAIACSADGSPRSHETASGGNGGSAGGSDSGGAQPSDGGAPSGGSGGQSEGQGGAVPVPSGGADGGIAPGDSAASQQSGWAALLDWSSQPTFGTATTALVSSTQRVPGGPFQSVDPGNKDYNSFLAVCGKRPALRDQQVDTDVECGPGEEGYLIAAADGPGYITRISVALGNADDQTGLRIRANDERVRIYVDGAPTPVYDDALADWYGLGHAPFEAPLVGWTSGATISYLPISYQSKIRVFLDDLEAGGESYYTNVSFRSSAPTASFDPDVLSTAAARADLDALVARIANADGASVWCNDDFTLDSGDAISVCERSGSGTIQRLSFRVDAAAADAVLANVALRVYWDGADDPAVDQPLAAIFGARQAVESFATWPMTSRRSGDQMELTFTLPMPFRDGARLQLVRTGATERTLHVRVDGTSTVPAEPFGELHTSFVHRAKPASGEKFVVADITGRGRYVGTMMFMEGQSDKQAPIPFPLNFLEGDDTLEVDGVVNQGTGTEDYFGGGWYFWDGPFDSPFASLAHLRQEPFTGLGDVTVMRWNILSDVIDFQDHFKLSFEYGANKPATAIDYSATAFYYQ